MLQGLPLVRGAATIAGFPNQQYHFLTFPFALH
jgi:hypothetical protein